MNSFVRKGLVETMPRAGRDVAVALRRRVSLNRSVEDHSSWSDCVPFA
jgi:hypothetical protein